MAVVPWTMLDEETRRVYEQTVRNATPLSAQELSAYSSFFRSVEVDATVLYFAALLELDYLNRQVWKLRFVKNFLLLVIALVVLSAAWTTYYVFHRWPQQDSNAFLTFASHIPVLIFVIYLASEADSRVRENRDHVSKVANQSVLNQKLIEAARSARVLMLNSKPSLGPVKETVSRVKDNQDNARVYVYSLGILSAARKKAADTLLDEVDPQALYADLDDRPTQVPADTQAPAARSTLEWGSTQIGPAQLEARKAK
jgi:hypothetical protein